MLTDFEVRLMESVALKHFKPRWLRVHPILRGKSKLSLYDQQDIFALEYCYVYRINTL